MLVKSIIHTEKKCNHWYWRQLQLFSQSAKVKGQHNENGKIPNGGQNKWE